jgi:hypothetical protein
MAQRRSLSLGSILWAALRDYPWVDYVSSNGRMTDEVERIWKEDVVTSE